MNQIQSDITAYSLAYDYLLNLNIAQLTPELLDRYLNYPDTELYTNSIEEIYKQILESAQNANMKSSVIGKAINGIANLNTVLCNFQPSGVIEKYSTWELVLNNIEMRLNLIGKIRKAPQSIWPKYCKTILSAAKFMSQFTSADDFYNWVDIFDKDDRIRPALPMLLANEINGFGFALACDFLKELGYINFAKPDVHLRDIFIGLKLCDDRSNDYQIFKAVIRVAKNVHLPPYNVDKLFWLIGSGYFYNDKQIGNKGRIGSHKKDFIIYAKDKLI